MSYKDKDKQREAQRERIRRYRAKQKGVTSEGVTGKALLTIDGVTEAPPPETPYPKRGKDIKCFEDLHPEIQASIDSISRDKNGKLDEGEKARRTSIAVNYQHLFPDRYEPKSDLRFTTLMAQADPKTKIKVSKPGDPDYNGVLAVAAIVAG